MGIPNIGPMELGIILVIILIIFGVGRLPQVGGALGKAIREFRRGKMGEASEGENPEKKNRRKDTKKSKKEAD